MFGIFGRHAKQPPLTEFCAWLSEPANLLKNANAIAANVMAAGPPPYEDTLRANLLSTVIMGAAGRFDLRGDTRQEKLEAFEGLRRYFRDTNLDVITAEAIVWVHFLMGRLFVADQKKDRETGKSNYTTERVGDVTFPAALRVVFHMIEEKTGVADFEEIGIGRREMYDVALDRGEVYEPFASVVLGSVERRSLTDPLKKFDSLEQPILEWTQLCARVSIFASAIPPRYYETFKLGIDQLIDRGM